VDRLLQGDVDHDGVKAAIGYLDGLIETESKEVPASRIVIGGFSQVCMFKAERTCSFYCMSSIGVDIATA